MKKITCNFFVVLYLLIGAISIVSCSKNEDLPVDKKEPAVQMTLNEQTKIATIKVSGLAAKTPLQLLYATARGQVLAEALVKEDGTQQFEVEQLVGFDQNLKVVVKENETKKTLKELNVPAATQTLTQQQLVNMLTKHAWNSVAHTSRVLVANSDNKLYAMFVTMAQKTFKFEANNKFIFTVTSPRNYTYENGSWTINNSVLNISTRIPIGPLEMKNLRVTKITDSELSLLVEISDGLFLISFEAQK